MTRAGLFRLTLSAAALALSAPALADDPRLKTLVFDEAQVVRIDGVCGVWSSTATVAVEASPSARPVTVRTFAPETSTIATDPAVAVTAHA